MPQFKITVKQTSAITNGVKIEAGMSAIVTCRGGQWSSEFRDAVQDAFLNRVGVDLKKGNFIGANYLDVKTMVP